MRPKPLRLWAYHAEWRICGVNFAMLPEVADPGTLRRLRRQARKQAARLLRRQHRRKNRR